MSGSDPRQRFTYRALQTMPEDGARRELLEGELLRSPAPSTRHQTISRRLQYELMTALERTGLASVFNAPVDVVFDERNVVEPDLVIVSRERQRIVTHRAIEGVPDVVVEILSPSTSDYDCHGKYRLYQRFGVSEYWIIDPENDWMNIHSLEESSYRRRAQLGAEGTLTCPLFPGLSLGLEGVFARDGG